MSRELAITSIVDTRADAQLDLDDCLGAFLAYYLARWVPAGNASLAEVTQRFAAQTARIKSERRYLDSLVDMKLFGKVWPLVAERDRPFVLRRLQPITAAISNVRLQGTWIDRYRPGRILEYARSSPTGPMFPLVVTPTTMDEVPNVGVTYRLTGFSREKIAGFTARFLEESERPDGSLALKREANSPEGMRRCSSEEVHNGSPLRRRAQVRRGGDHRSPLPQTGEESAGDG